MILTECHRSKAMITTRTKYYRNRTPREKRASGPKILWEMALTRKLKRLNRQFNLKDLHPALCQLITQRNLFLIMKLKKLMMMVKKLLKGLEHNISHLKKTGQVLRNKYLHRPQPKELLLPVVIHLHRRHSRKL